MLIIKNAKTLATCRAHKGKPLTGRAFSDSGVIENGALIIDKGIIKKIGKTQTILKKFKPGKKDQVIDAADKIIIPGFIDCHTHAVFSGSRAHEYQLKLKGVSYSEIHKKSGGIYYTVAETKKATEKELYLRAKKILREILLSGTTTLEIKSGYGLTLKDELKILRVIKRLKESEPLDIIATFLGAHTIPLKYKNKRGEYVEEITKNMLPRVKKESLAEYCDVFCDPLGFTPQETIKIFKQANKLGLKLRIHADQTAHFGGTRIAAQFNAASADHCDYASNKDIELLAKNKVPVVLLPGVLFHLMEWQKIPQIQKLTKKLKQYKVPIILASDYNPGSSPITSMKMIMDLALRFLKLDYSECLNAATINAAHALDRDNFLGSIEKGKQADLLIIDSPSIKDYLHHAGDKQIKYIIKRGKVIK